MMKVTLSVTMVVVLILFSFGCGKGNRPTEPGVERQIEYFDTPEAIFDPNDDDLIDNPGGFHEVDLARILEGWDPCTPDSVINWYDYTTAAVTLQRGTGPGDPFKPVIRFLQGNSGGAPDNGTFSDVHWVTDWDVPDGDHQAEYKHPKCDAIAFLWNGEFVFEVTVVYQIHGLTISEVNQSLHDDFYGTLQDERNNVDGDWDIGGTILRWDEDDFPNGEPERHDFIIPDTGYNSQWPDSDPDVAYDRVTGDCYIVYSKAETPLGIEKSTIKYVMLNRDWDNQPSYLDDDIIFNPNGGWMFGWPRRVQMNENHNGHTPSIAIGLLDFFIWDDPGYHWIEDMRWVCVAYTSQFDNHTGYHVIAGGWQLVSGGYDNRYFFPVRHPTYGELDAGFPCLAITPNVGCTRNFAALALTQQIGSDGYGPVLKVYEVDLFGVGNLINPTEWFPITTPDNYADCIYPSIALHTNNNEMGPFYSSVTFMAQDPYNDVLVPAVSQLEIEDLHVMSSTPHLVAHRVDHLSDNIENAGEITGNYNLSQVPFIDPGVTTAIVTGGGRYWAAWSERIEMEPPPVYLYGTYGWIGQ